MAQLFLLDCLSGLLCKSVQKYPLSCPVYWISRTQFAVRDVWNLQMHCGSEFIVIHAQSRLRLAVTRLEDAQRERVWARSRYS